MITYSDCGSYPWTFWLPQI